MRHISLKRVPHVFECFQPILKMFIERSILTAIILRQDILVDKLEQRVTASLMEAHQIVHLFAQYRLGQRHETIDERRRIDNVILLKFDGRSLLQEFRVSEKGFDVARHIEQLLEAEADDVEHEDLTLAEAIVTIVVGSVVGVEHH